MEVRNAAVYWNLKNVTKGINNITLMSTPKNVTFEEGKVFSKDSDLNLKKFEPMLGFLKDTTVRANTWTKSPSKIDINLGLQYVTVECISVDTDRNFDRYGKRSKVIATLPVTTEHSLNSSVTHYRNLTCEVAVVNGDHNLFEFKVGTNLEKEVDLKVMLELYLD